MASVDEATLKNLYEDERLSAKQIADRLDVTEPTVVYWLDKYRIRKRSISEAIYQRINSSGDPFKVKMDLSFDEEKLKVAGLMLWATEGSRKSKHTVYTSNSDPNLIKLFVKFLLGICQVRKDKIRLRVLYYPNMEMSIAEVKNFWSQETGLPENQININTYTANHDYRSISRYGTATVAVSNIKLLKQMETWLKELYGKSWI